MRVSHCITPSYTAPCGSSTRRPHPLFRQFRISCRTMCSRNLLLPTPVAPTTYICMLRSLAESVSLPPLGAWAIKRSLPGNRRIGLYLPLGSLFLVQMIQTTFLRKKFHLAPNLAFSEVFMPQARSVLCRSRGTQL